MSRLLVDLSSPQPQRGSVQPPAPAKKTADENVAPAAAAKGKAAKGKAAHKAASPHDALVEEALRVVAGVREEKQNSTQCAPRPARLTCPEKLGRVRVRVRVTPNPHPPGHCPAHAFIAESMDCRMQRSVPALNTDQLIPDVSVLTFCRLVGEGAIISGLSQTSPAVQATQTTQQRHLEPPASTLFASKKGRGGPPQKTGT